MQSGHDNNNYYTFHECTKDVEILLNGKVARGARQSTDQYGMGRLVTREPLQAYRRWEIEINSPPLQGTISVGITSDDTVSSMENKFNIKFTGKVMAIVIDGKVLQTIHLNRQGNIKVGDTLGVMKEHDGVLFYHNNEVVEATRNLQNVDHGLLASLVKKSLKLYGVVEMPSHVPTQISIFGRDTHLNVEAPIESFDTLPVEYRSSNQHEQAMYRMKMVVKFLQGMSDIDIKVASQLVDQYLLQPLEKETDDNIMQSYGDHLAALDTGKLFKKLVERIQDSSDFEIIHPIRKACWCYSDASLKLCRSFGRCELLKDMIDDLRKYGPNVSNDKTKRFIQYSALSILHNSAKATENRHILCGLDIVKNLSPFLNCECKELAVASCVCMVITIDYKENISQDKLKFVVEVFDEVLQEPYLRRKSEDYGRYSALEIVSVLGKIAVNHKNNETIIKLGTLSLFEKLLKKDRPVEQECVANTLVELAKVETSKNAILDSEILISEIYRLKNTGNVAVQRAMDRLLDAINGQERTDTARKRCEYENLCERFKQEHLQLPEVLFKKEHSKCYCNSCITHRKEDLYAERGEPKKIYGRPIGWYRFALVLPPRSIAFNSDKDWHMAFYGTTQVALKPIFRAGQIPLPGKLDRSK
ncbi:uncharacterized protein LOC144450972 [Glandiceps talaboti]